MQIRLSIMKSLKKHIFISFNLITFCFVLISCGKKEDGQSRQPKEELKQAIPLTVESFRDVAVQYKDAMDLGQRGNLVSLVEKNSRQIIYHTINLEHMIYFAAVNGIGTNKLILMLRTENQNLQFRNNEIQWINDRWKFESESLLNEKFTRPKIPLIKELHLPVYHALCAMLEVKLYK